MSAELPKSFHRQTATPSKSFHWRIKSFHWRILKIWVWRPCTSTRVSKIILWFWAQTSSFQKTDPHPKIISASWVKWFWGANTKNNLEVPAPWNHFMKNLKWFQGPCTIFWEVVHDIQSHFLEMILRSQNCCWNDFRVGVSDCWNDFRVWEVYVGKMSSRGGQARPPQNHFRTQSVGVIVFIYVMRWLCANCTSSVPKFPLFCAVVSWDDATGCQWCTVEVGIGEYISGW